MRGYKVEEENVWPSVYNKSIIYFIFVPLLVIHDLLFPCAASCLVHMAEFNSIVC